MAGAGRGEPKGSYQPDGTAAAHAHYGDSLEAILGQHGYALESGVMPVVDSQGRRVGGRHGARGVGRFGAHWNRERDGGHTGDQGGGGYTSGGEPDSGAQGW